jgi:hypothetical protein
VVLKKIIKMALYKELHDLENELKKIESDNSTNFIIKLVNSLKIKSIKKKIKKISEKLVEKKNCH